MEIRSLNPILDPLTIITNIIINDGREIFEIEKDKEKNKVININSNLNSKIMIFFRHQHILIILKDNIIVI